MRLIVPLPDPEGPSMVRTGITAPGLIMWMPSGKCRAQD
jgi:hypothetical protein